jgi:formylglycine-generating enzyme required for sulfatase activity
MPSPLQRLRLIVVLTLTLVPSGWVFTPRQARALDFTWITIGDPGNPSDPSGFGSLPYVFRMGKYETTNTQYAEFLNAKAALGDPLALYSASMGTDPRGGIARSGSGTAVDPFVYSPRANMANKPVNFVGFFDAARMANWMNNGEANADTENGAYTLLGGTPTPSNWRTLTRNPGAQVYLPNDDEWTKTSLYEPGHAYWFYGTRSNATPTKAQATATGDVANPGTNVANYGLGASWNGQNGNVTTVGGCGPNSYSYYGAADMTGNVFEWCDNIYVVQGFNMRSLRGGSFVEQSNAQIAGAYGSASPGIEVSSFGFRLAAADVPEPCGLIMLCAAAAGLLCRAPRALT